jgi:hypothetical protein
MHKTLTKEPPDAPLNHGSCRCPMAALVPPQPALRHTTTNQDHWTSFLSGEAWQIALGCRYGSQRTPWWSGCRQDNLASNLRSKGKKIARSPNFCHSQFLPLLAKSVFQMAYLGAATLPNSSLETNDREESETINNESKDDEEENHNNTR